MPEHHLNTSGLPLTVVERPCCPVCQNRTNLMRITPGAPGYDFHAFQCAKCNHVDTRMVCTDPMKAGSAGWANSDLWPPK